VKRLTRSATTPASRRDWTAFTPKLLTVMREGYSPAHLRADALAGLTVAIIALPLAMALGIASGASPDKGLVTAIVAGLLISALGGSRVQIGGPTGAFVVVVFSVIANHGYDGLVLATMVAGLLLIIAGYAGAGRLIRYIPHPVITGFTAGIAVIIATSQIKDFLGLDVANVPAEFIPKWAAYLGAIGTIDWTTFALAAASLMTIVAVRIVAPKLPAFLIAVIAGSAAVWGFGLHVDTIGARFPDMQLGLPPPAFPAFSMAKVQEVLPSAFTIAFLAGIEALLSCVVADGMTGFRHRSGQELIGQGAGNMASALFGGLPATGALARTAANVKAGGRTPVAGICHSLFLLCFVLFASRALELVPMAVLAAVLLVVAWGMSEARRFLLLMRMPIGERTVLLITFTLTILVDLTVAIGVGVTLASLMFIARMSESVAVTPDSEVEDAEQRENLPEGVEVFRINGPFFFGVAGELLDALKRIGRAPRAIILRMEEVPFIDASGAVALAEFLEQAAADEVQVVLCAPRPQLLALLKELHGPGTVPHAPDYPAAIALAAEQAVRGETVGN
jgi:SulP family sulfate permease